MIKKEVNLRGYFKSYDEVTKKITMLFLDDENDAFTKSYLTQFYNPIQNTPVKQQEFYIKFNITKSMCYLDKSDQARVPVQDLLHQIVKVCIYISHYNFNSRGKNVTGWNINLLQMNSI